MANYNEMPEELPVELPVSDMPEEMPVEMPVDAEPSAQDAPTNKDEDFVRDPYVQSSYVSNDEIEAVASKYGVSRSVLELGIDMQNVGRKLNPNQDTAGKTADVARELMQKLGGATNQIVGMGVPWKAFKQIAYDENTQKALDEIESTASERRSYLDAVVNNTASPWAGFFGKSIATAGKEAYIAGKFGMRGEKLKELAKMGALAAPTGALAGYGSSKTGEELENAVKVAAFGAVGVPLLHAGVEAAAGKLGDMAKERAFRKVNERAGEASDRASSMSASEVEGRLYRAEAELEMMNKYENDGGINPEWEQLASDIEELKHTKEIQDEMIAAQGEAEGGASGQKVMEEMGEVLPEDLEAHTKYDIIYKAEEAYKANRIDKPLENSFETEIENSLVQSIKGEELDNPFVGEMIFKSRYKSEDLADKAWAKLKSDYMKVNKLDRDIEAEMALSADILEHEKFNLAKELNPAATKEDFEKVLKANIEGLGKGEQGVREAIAASRKHQYALKVLEENSASLATETASLHGASRYLHSNAVLDRIDSKYGTKTNEAANTMVKNTEKMATNVKVYEQRADNLMKDIHKISSFQGEEGGRIVAQIIDMGETGAQKMRASGLIDKEELTKARELGKFFYMMGRVLNKEGLAMPLIKASDGSPAYFPIMMKSGREVRSILTNEYKALVHKLEAVDDFSELSERAIDFVDSLKVAAGKPIRNMEDVYAAMKVLKDDAPGTISRLNAARATQMRKGNKVPDIIREYDVGKVLNGYLKNSFKQLAMRDQIAELSRASVLAEKAGDTRAKNYLDRMIEDVLSIRERSWFDQYLEGMKDKYTPEILKLEREKKELMKQVFSSMQPGEKPISIGDYARAQNPRIAEIEDRLSSIRLRQEVPEVVISFLRTSFMSNLLGGKLKAGIRDLYQPYTLGTVEIGGKYGASVMADATKQYFTNPTSLKKMENELIAKGRLSPDFAGQISSSREAGDMYSEFAKSFKNVAEKYTKLFMVFRRTAEIINRTTMARAAERIATDYMEGAVGKNYQQAQRYLDSRLSEAYRTKIRLLQAGGKLTQEKLVDIVADDLIAKTQFIYHPSMKSELARDLGPMLTQFSHYPSGVASFFDIEVRKHGWGSATKKAMGPVVGLLGMHMLYDKMAADEEGMSEREKVFFYQGGATGAAPVAGLAGIVPGVGPSSKMGSNFLKLFDGMDFSQEYAKKWSKFAAGAADSFNPLGSSMNFSKDVIALITGERPSFGEIVGD